MMQAYVINVPETVDATLSKIRRNHMEDELTRSGLHYQWVDAVDGTRLTSGERELLVDETVVTQYPHWLMPGVIGASLSHLQAYRQIIADPAPIGLVLEDDVILPPHFTSLLGCLERSLTGSDVALLYWNTWPGCQLSSRQPLQLDGDARLMRPIDARLVKSAAAYAITRQACEGMLESRLPIRAGTDNWLDFLKDGAFERLWVLVPRLLDTRTDFKSTVEYHRTGSLSARLSQSVAHRQVFGLYHLLAWRRSRMERKASAFAIVDRPPL